MLNSYMVYLGVFVGGPANLISSAISADLGKQVHTYHIRRYCHMIISLWYAKLDVLIHTNTTVALLNNIITFIKINIHCTCSM